MLTASTPVLDTDERTAWYQLDQAAADPAIDSALRTLYTDIHAAIAQRGPTCWQSGKCCNFVEFGHLLYVTALEACWFTQHAPPPPDRAPIASSSLPLFPTSPIAHRPSHTSPTCPYQVNKACTTHAIRPLGCRIFFCQRGTEAWQQALYESFQHRLRGLHDDHALPYRYLEWRAALDLARSLPDTPIA